MVAVTEVVVWLVEYPWTNGYKTMAGMPSSSNSDASKINSVALGLYVIMISQAVLLALPVLPMDIKLLNAANNTLYFLALPICPSFGSRPSLCHTS